MPEKNNNQKEKVAETQNKAKEKPLSGTEDSSNNNKWEKAADMIAGNNQLMATLLKLLLSPLTLIAGAGLIIYLFFKNDQLRKEVSKLKEENKELTDEKEAVAEEADDLERKYLKIKKVLELEQNRSEQYHLPKETQSTVHNINKNKMSYLK